jgi:hypothetical protein
MRATWVTLYSGWDHSFGEPASRLIHPIERREYGRREDSNGFGHMDWKNHAHVYGNVHWSNTSLLVGWGSPACPA